MSKGNSFGVFAILLLLCLGYFIPTAILAVEDEGLIQEEKSIAIEKIELITPKADVVEQLRIFEEMMFSHIVISMDGDKVHESVKQPENETEYRNDESNLRACVQEFWQVFKEEVLVYEKFSFTNYIMMAGNKNDSMHSIWECTSVDKDGKEYYFWIDDATGKVVAFDIPYENVGYMDEEFYAAINRLTEYYGFSSYEFIDILRNLYKTKYWQNGIILREENMGVELSLNIYKSGDRLQFNNYPNTKSFSESR